MSKITSASRETPTTQPSGTREGQVTLEECKNRATKVSWCCRFHPTNWWHEIGCPHCDWSKEQLYDALLTQREFERDRQKTAGNYRIAFSPEFNEGVEPVASTQRTDNGSKKKEE